MSVTSLRLAIIVTDIYALEVLTRGQLEYFHAAGVKLDLYCGGSKDRIAAFRRARPGRLTRIPFRRPPHPFLDVICLVWLTALLIVRRYDGVVYSTPKAMLLGSIAAALTLQRHRVALVRGRAYEGARGIRRRLYVLLDRATFLLSHRVIFISHSLLAAYSADPFGRSKDRFEVLGSGSSNGVDLDRFVPASPERRRRVRERLGIPANAFLVLFVGRIAPDKGVSVACELVRRTADIENIHWVFVGGVEDQKLYEELRSLDSERVRLEQHTSGIEDWFAAADLHHMPTRREGFGNVAIEAAACQVPTVGFDVVGLRDSVAQGISGVLCPFEDIDAIEAIIREAAKDPHAFASRYAGARDWVAENFPQERVWSNYLNAFLDLSEQPSVADKGRL